MHHTYLGPAFCFHILSFLSFGLARGVAVVRWLLDSRYSSLSFVTLGLTGSCCRAVTLMTVASLFTDMAGNIPLPKEVWLSVTDMVKANGMWSGS